MVALIKWNLVDPQFSSEFMSANEDLEHHCITLITSGKLFVGWDKFLSCTDEHAQIVRLSCGIGKSYRYVRVMLEVKRLCKIVSLSNCGERVSTDFYLVLNTQSAIPSTIKTSCMRFHKVFRKKATVSILFATMTNLFRSYNIAKQSNWEVITCQIENYKTVNYVYQLWTKRITVTGILWFSQLHNTK